MALPGGVLLEDVCMARDVVLPEGIQQIGARWFWGSCIESVQIPASVEEIGKMAFYNCRRLTQATFASGSRLRSIGVSGFYNTNIEKITLPQGVTKIPDCAFYNSGNLREVAFEAERELETIGCSAFSRCRSLEKMHFPEGLKSIGC